MSDDRMVHPNSPVHFEHWCDYDGCKRRGSFGIERSRAITERRCMEHLADDYWEGRKITRN
ncbi:MULTISPECIES: hypothetical protein [unclassified Rhizobium]|uniref:hypothetical protein n=1 Tax=unclassified Rhizobium TaxID=2613769 RepID=UPI000761A679|nr:MULTISPECIES: hypothetical protein [unclassified Rhizobium]